MRAIKGLLLCTCLNGYQFPWWFQDSSHFLKSFYGIRDCAENKSCDHVIEAIIRKVQVLGVHRIKSDVFPAFYFFPGSLKHAFAFVDPYYPTACRIVFQVPSGAYPDFQNFPAQAWKRFFSPFPKKEKLQRQVYQFIYGRDFGCTLRLKAYKQIYAFLMISFFGFCFSFPYQLFGLRGSILKSRIMNNAVTVPVPHKSGSLVRFRSAPITNDKTPIESNIRNFLSNFFPLASFFWAINSQT